ncbi:MAG: hypothetical protein Q3972_04815 [Corynebacterium sp.]|nr:hypothetical protein [Corynebacterium sp.]
MQEASGSVAMPGWLKLLLGIGGGLAAIIIAALAILPAQIQLFLN